LPKAKFASKPHLSGTKGGHTINLHQFVRDGITLLGRVQGVRDNDLVLARDLKDNLAKADRFEAEFVRRVDEFIAKSGMEAPREILLS
jgi:putative flavoprotein involved in K+ transport